MVEVEGLTKVYGNRVSIWKVTFQVRKGEILGFLGPNGAGKTTTMRIITGFVPASSGTATVAGFDVSKQPLEVKSRIGYLCEAPPVYREMVVRSYLKFVAEIKRLPRSRHKAAIERAIELCGLNDVAGRVIGHLSKGYRQRVGLAQAILHEPEVLILDEPTSGLDPRQIIEIRERIRELGGEQTVILSTHILPEVTATCSRVVIINEGQIVAQDSTENLTSGLGKTETVHVQVGRDEAGLKDRMAALHGVQEVKHVAAGRFLVRHDGGEAARERLAAEVVASGAGLLEMAREKATLEEVFLQLVTEENSEEHKESAA
jgi:ABC-2 type transport system ATP-binding protein